MTKKYIIEIPANEVVKYSGAGCLFIPYEIAGKSGYIDTGLVMTPYTKPDMKQVRKEAFEKGYSTAGAEQECAVRGAAEKGYQKGLSDGKNQDAKDFTDMYDSGYNEGLKDGWEVAWKIYSMDGIGLSIGRLIYQK